MYNREILIKDMKKEDVPLNCQRAVEIIGLEAFVRLSDNIGGTSFYVPKFEQVVVKARDRHIVKEFDGKNIKELAIKYDLTEMSIRNIIAKDRLEKNQISLFDIR